MAARHGNVQLACVMALRSSIVGRSRAALQREINAELVAVALFHRAADHDITLTRPWIEAELDRLRSHSPTCRCNELCGLSRGVTAARVHYVARCWSISTAATRRLAQR